jgi:hypothetical protein
MDKEKEATGAPRRMVREFHCRRKRNNGDSANLKLALPPKWAVKTREKDYWPA